jgi:hypothetical protein
LDENWQQLSEQILTDIKEWRRAHPKATLREIEEEVHLRMSRLEAQVIQDAAQESQCRDWSGAAPEQRPTCPVYGTPLHARGKRTTSFASGRRTRHQPDEKLWDLPHVWDGHFSPSMSN